ncbi:DUF6777 domain-containing protein [Pseudonocardia humida]|nr:DUF6777 domain-containing protein [Pseudonocardia humida]
MASAIAVIADPPWAEVVHREPAGSAGAFPPFVPSNGDSEVVPAPVVTNLAAVTGDTPGLYGGTRTNACDAQAIRTHLEADPAKAGAWASALGLAPAAIGPLLASLTPVTLRTDTAVTNHGFEDGRPTPFQSVLQAGTAVLVDPLGLPRVRCYCGNPLAEPDRRSAVRYTDPAWNGFAEDAVTVITRAPAQVRDFVVVAPGTNEVVTRPRGTSGEQDRPADPGLAAKVGESIATDSGAGGAAPGAVADPAVPAAPDPNTVDAADPAIPPTVTTEPAVPGPSAEPDVVIATDPGVTTATDGAPPGAVDEPVADPDPGARSQVEPDPPTAVEPDPVTTDPDAATDTGEAVVQVDG